MGFIAPLSREEVIIFILASLFFVIMDAVVIAQGKLVFSESFVFGVPAWELFMWGFTTVHAKRLTFLNDKPVFWAPGLVLMLFYMIIFSIPIGDTPLFAASAALLILGLFFKHDPLTLRYTGYLLLLGFLYETTGVASGLWHYPQAHFIPIPLWFTTMWAGTGFFMICVVWPGLSIVLQRIDGSRSEHSA